MNRSVYESVFNAQPRPNTTELLADAFGALTQQELSMEDFLAEEDRLYKLNHRNRRSVIDSDWDYQENSGAVSRTDAERIAMMRELVDIVTYGYEYCNTLFDWPMYAKLMQEFGQKLPGGNALALGALTAMSTRAFVTLAEEVYGADRAYVVDLVAGTDKRKHGNFIFGDALRLPFQSSSMDIVHSSNVLAKLQDPSGDFSDYESQRQQVFKEAGRVLRPNGQLIMIEEFPDTPVPNENIGYAGFYRYMREVGDRIYPELKAAGLGKLGLIEYRRSDYDFLYDPSRNFEQYFGHAPLLGAFALHATKSEYAQQR